jgi:hypothetical protein
MRIWIGHRQLGTSSLSFLGEVGMRVTSACSIANGTIEKVVDVPPYKGCPSDFTEVHFKRLRRTFDSGRGE